MSTGHAHDPDCIGISDEAGILWWDCSDGQPRNAWVIQFQSHPRDVQISSRYIAATKAIREKE